MITAVWLIIRYFQHIYNCSQDKKQVLQRCAAIIGYRHERNALKSGHAIDATYSSPSPRVNIYTVLRVILRLGVFDK